MVWFPDAHLKRFLEGLGPPPNSPPLPHSCWPSEDRGHEEFSLEMARARELCFEFFFFFLPFCAPFRISVFR